MALPYSCLEACELSEEGKSEWVVFGTSGSRLAVQSSSGATTVWPQADAQRDETEAEGPPEKKIKLSTPTAKSPNFSCLTVTNDKKHLVAVTAEDKAIRVFSIDAECQLHQLSERCMARRPCALSVTADDSTILCADKFGDVYALPLILGPDDEKKEATPSEASEAVTETPYVPAATVLTVHSGRNRKVLEEQLKQSAKGPKKPKEAPSFKHDLLLGHVSMLTDIAYAKVDSRSYIITADRDEHIRVSRGIPQAHIIEGFCHGHEAFISRLCLASGNRLVSGGGDPYLCVWDWMNYRLLEQLDIRDAVLQFMKSQSHLSATLPEHLDKFRTAVSGIWSVPTAATDAAEILVACEGIPALFSFRLGGSSTANQTIALAGNPLDLTFIYPSQGTCTAVVSIDNVHVPGSTTEIRKDECPSRLQYFSYRIDHWEEDQAAGQAYRWLSENAGQTDEATADQKALRDILYGIENLRKRPGSED